MWGRSASTGVKSAFPPLCGAGLVAGPSLRWWAVRGLVSRWGVVFAEFVAQVVEACFEYVVLERLGFGEQHFDC